MYIKKLFEQRWTWESCTSRLGVSESASEESQAKKFRSHQKQKPRKLNKGIVKGSRERRWRYQSPIASQSGSHTLDGSLSAMLEMLPNPPGNSIQAQRNGFSRGCRLRYQRSKILREATGSGSSTAVKPGSLSLGPDWQTGASSWESEMVDQLDAM